MIGRSGGRQRQGICSSYVIHVNAGICTRICGMSRSFRAFVLLSVLLWQSMAIFGSMTVTQQVEELEHMMVHCQDINHHHHADMALHMEDDEGGVQHVHADSANNPSALLPLMVSVIPDARSTSPVEGRLAIWLSPTLEGPLRPPMQRA